MRIKLMTGLTVLAALTVTSTAYPAGFAIIEQSVKGLGHAYAGAAATCDDATTIFFNPAGLSRLDGHQVVAGFHVVIPRAKFENQGSTHVLQAPPFNGPPLLGPNGGDARVTGYIPNVYYAYNGINGWSFGVGVNAPFALSTEYKDKEWVGRYHALKSSLTSVNINPTVAYRIPYDMVHQFSIGFGVSAQYMDATLNNAIDFGTIDAGTGFSPFPRGFFGLTPQQDDGFAEVTGDNWSWGFNLGVLVEFTEATRAGIAYRSKVTHDIEGTATFVTPDTLQVIREAGFFTDCDATAEVEFPDNLSLSVFHQIGDEWAIMGDVTWTRWSVFDELRFNFSSNQPDAVTTEDWKDSWRFAVGWTFTPNDAWTGRAGVAYDRTPIPDPQHRTPRIPGEDRYWLALGGGYQLNERFRADIGYAHLFVSDPTIDKSGFALEEDRIRGGLKGTYDAAVDIVSLEVSYTF